MEDERPPEAPDGEASRVYPPAEVQARLQVSASGLRRLAGIYERTVGLLPRDERGRVWPEGAVEELESAREAVQSQRAVSIEAALRDQKNLEASPAGTTGAEPHIIPGSALQGRAGEAVGAAILKELRALRELVEEQNRRIAELEETVRGEGRGIPFGELEAPSTTVDTPRERRASPGKAPWAGQDRGQDQPEPGPWQRVLAWFGFGVRRP